MEPAHFWSQGPLVNGVNSWQLIIKHDLTHQFHGRTLGVRPRVLFHIGEGTDVEMAHFWSQSPLVNGVKSWQLIIKHDLTHRFHGQILGVLPSARVPHRFGTGPFLEPGSTFDGVTRWQLIIKPDFTHLFHGRTLGVRPSVRVPYW